MKEVAGTTCFSELSELLDPGHVALIVVDMQNDLCRADGWMAREAETAGADIRCSTRLDRAVRQDDRIFLPQTGLRTRYLVGADGARSTVARLFDLSALRVNATSGGQ